ncbi:MAG: DUF4287 domain-containing protein, partial [Bdellovibrionota bacterium]
MNGASKIRSTPFPGGVLNFEYLMSAQTIRKIGRVTSVSVAKGTGRTWQQWIAILTEHGAARLSHQKIVAWLASKYKLGPWWQQGVTHGFEVHIGRRIDGQNQKGLYSTTATKSIPVSSSALWKFLFSKPGLEAWLAPLGPFKLEKDFVYETRSGHYGQIRTYLKGTRLRLSFLHPDWGRATFLNLLVVSRKPTKTGKTHCLIVFTHDGLRTVAE